MLALKDLRELDVENHWEATQLQCVKDCQLDPEEAPSSYFGFRRWLADEVDYWIRTNPEKLAQSLYRSDLSHKQVADLFAHWNLDDESLAWAEVFIRKSLQKVLLRKHYSQKP